jgi:4-amino-4-deoxychorismate lyase
MPSQSPLRDGDTTGFDLIETLRWEPASGFLRLKRHLARLFSSANELGLTCKPETIGSALGAVGGTSARRVRLLLSPDGNAVVTTQPFEPLPEDTIWTLRIAKTRLASGDPLLRHKTTRRDAYQAARSEFSSAEADEVLLLNERSEVCEGTITTVFVDAGDGGPLLTPPLSCGLLAGVLRGELLDEGKAREAILTPTDLDKAKTLLVGNSLRGLIHARIAYD